MVAFYRNSADRMWGTTQPDWVERNLRLGAPSEQIEVAALDFSKCLQQFGVPHYLKVDIEGADLLCVESLRTVTPRPDYLSIESNKTDFAALLHEFELLFELGYRGFAVVQQARIHELPYSGSTRAGAPFTHHFQAGASGPFGKELGVAYGSREEAIERYRRIFQHYRIFGDDSPLRNNRFNRLALRSVKLFWRHVLGRELPGWYDTHAALSIPSYTA
jgi:hypothetical protein